MKKHLPKTDSPSLQLWPLTVTNGFIMIIICIYIYPELQEIIFPFITVKGHNCSGCAFGTGLELR